MDIKLLPAFIKINFEGYRGYFEEDLELSGKHLDNGQFSLSYSHDGAQFALKTIIADNPKEAFRQMYNFCKKYNLLGFEEKVLSMKDTAKMV
jgi:hypothetical protein